MDMRGRLKFIFLVLLLVSIFPSHVSLTTTSASFHTLENDNSDCPEDQVGDDPSCPFTTRPLYNNTFEETFTGEDIRWQIIAAIKNVGYNYTLNRNGTFRQGSQNHVSQSIIEPLDTINNVLGLHVYQLQINYTKDSTDYSKLYEVWVTVIELSAPEISVEPQSTHSFQQNTTQDLVWVASDNSTTTYSIEVNNTVDPSYDGLTLTNGQDITYTLGPTTPTANTSTVNTLYNIEIIFIDDLGQQSSDIVYVTIIDNSAPVFDESPNPVFYQVGSSDNFLNWTVSDQDPSVYNITRDGSLLTPPGTLTIPLDGKIGLNIDGLAIGTYQYQIFVYDEFGNVNSNSVEVNVADNSNPVILEFPDDISYTYGEVGNEITYQVYDDTPTNYRVFRNGTLLRQETWEAYEDEVINLDGFGVGVHNVTVVFFDNQNNKVSDLVYVTVIPIGTSTPNLSVTSTVMSGSSETISGTWTCETSDCGFNQGSVFTQLVDSNDTVVSSFSDSFLISSNGDYSLVFNYTKIAIGDYELQVFFSGTGLETQILSYDVEVIPVPVSLEIIKNGNIVRGSSYEFQVYVTVDETMLSGFGLDALTTPSGAISGIEVTFVLSYLNGDGEQMNWTDTVETNSNGYAIFNLNQLNTANIAEITGIEATASSPFSTHKSIVLDESEFPGLEGELPSPSSPDNGFDPMVIFAIATVVVIIVAAVSFFIIRRSNLDEISYYEQLQGLRSVILYNGEGVPIFDVNFGNFATSTTLVAGLSSAITTFLDELSESDRGELYIMEKSDLFVLSHKLEGSALAVISTLPYAESFKNNFAKAHKQVREEIDQKIFENSFSQSDEQLTLKTLDILQQNNIHLRVLYPSYIKFDVLREMQEDDLPKLVRSYYEILMDVEQLVDRPRNMDYWLDALEEFGVTRSDSIKLFIELDDYDLLSVSTHLLTS